MSDEKEDRLKLVDYEKEVFRTAKVSNELNWIYGIFGEAGEFIDAYKKMAYTGHPFETNKLLLELGDVLWYNTMCIYSFTEHSLNELVRSYFYFKRDIYSNKLEYFYTYHDYNFTELSMPDIHIELNKFIFTISNTTKKLIDNCVSEQKKEVDKNLYDVFYIISEVAYSLNSTIEEVAKMNIEKLRRRYPEGFSTERSMNREGVKNE